MDVVSVIFLVRLHHVQEDKRHAERMERVRMIQCIGVIQDLLHI